MALGVANKFLCYQEVLGIIALQYKIFLWKISNHLYKQVLRNKISNYLRGFSFERCLH